jgi:glycogen operon protein
MLRTTRSTWLDWEKADGALVDYACRWYAFRKGHQAVTHDHFLTGHASKEGRRDVVWLHPDGREMREGDWTDLSASVLGMLLSIAGDTVLVWFNRRMEPIRKASGWELAGRADL